jgi:hypothetical protein
MKKQRSWARLHSKENPLPHVIFEFRLNLLGVPHEREREREILGYIWYLSLVHHFRDFSVGCDRIQIA